MHFVVVFFSHLGYDVARGRGMLGLHGTVKGQPSAGYPSHKRGGNDDGEEDD